MNIVWLDDPGNTGWAPPTLQPGQTTTTSIGVNGAAIGDFVLVSNEIPSWPLNPKIGFSGQVIGPNTVSVLLANYSSEVFTAPSATWHARVMKRVSP